MSLFPSWFLQHMRRGKYPTVSVHISRSRIRTMSRLALLGSVLAILTAVAFSQTPTAQPSTSPVAYVYVSSPNPNTYGLIYAYSASSNGHLTLVGTFPSYASYMALNGAWLFGTDGTNIYSFSIASNGALSQTSSINATSYNPYQSGGPGNLFLDHTGTTLYDGDIYAYGTGSNAYQAFSIDQNTGQLNFLQLTPDANGSGSLGNVLSFTGSNTYAYSSGSYRFTQDIYGFKRNADQTLTELSLNPKFPTAPNGAYFPFLAASDRNNHLAISLTPYNGFSQTGPTQLAVYTQQSNGNLTTTSTSANMPTTLITNLYDFWMSPSGKLLAVAGVGGLQVFHFNGANPITHYTGRLTKDTITQVFWDNANHLYAISPSTGKLHVFTVTPTSHSEAPGSPYTISNASNVIVLPK